MEGASEAVAALALLYAIYKGTREWENWKRERREQKAAEVAGQVLVAALRFLSDLRWVTSSARYEKPEQSSQTEGAISTASEPEPPFLRQIIARQAKDLVEEQDARWQRFRPVEENFVAAWELSEVFLPDDIDALLERIWEKKASVFANQNAYINQVLQQGADTSFFDKAFGRIVQSEIDALRDEARAVLRPLAQLEAETV